MNKTAISWTDYSSNPIKARRKSDGKKGWFCVRVSEGCTHCYASTLNRRWGNGLDYTVPNLEQVEFYLDEREFAAWRRLREPSKIFVCDMTDLFGEWVPDEMIRQVWSHMALTPQHTFQVLTKRPARMNEWVGRLIFPERENIWLGVSVENQKAANERIPLLCKTPAAVRFLSCEPLLGPIELSLAFPCGYYCDESVGHVDHAFYICQGVANNGGIGWVIVGGESGPHFRPMEAHWARRIRDVCVAAEVPFFYKQGSGPRPGMNATLDGQEWHQFPQQVEV